MAVIGALDMGEILDVFVGAARAVRLTGLVDAAGEPVDCRVLTLTADCKPSPEGDVAASWTCTVPAGQTDSILLTLSATDTSAFVPGQQYFTDVRAVDSGNNEWIIAYGWFIARQPVS